MRGLLLKAADGILMGISVFDHPFLKGLTGHEEIAAKLSAEADIQHMLAFEAALARAEADLGIIDAAAGDAIADHCARFQPDVELLNKETANDGVVIPSLVRQLKAELPEDIAPSLHFGATSQDVIDTSLILRLKDILPILLSDLDQVLSELSKLKAKFGARTLMGKTRMQQALPITVAQRLDEWAAPLLKQKQAAELISEDLLKVQFGGAVGNLDRLGEKGPAVRAKLAEYLGLKDPGYCWHTDRTSLVNFANWLSILSGALGKVGIDVIQMAQNEVKEVYLIGGGGSSAMAHKQNPVRAELLVTLGRYNAAQMASMHGILQHENERSGSSWTLEWMILPQMIMATAGALRLGHEMLCRIEEIRGVDQ